MSQLHESGLHNDAARAAKPLEIDFVSDIVCPWCYIGLSALNQALGAIGDAADVTLRMQPFELNPNMGPAGQNVREHIAEKYGREAAESSGVRNQIRDRAASLGITMKQDAESRIYNSFDGHRLLDWARETAGEAGQKALKLALFDAYFTRGEDISDRETLIAVVGRAGLDSEAASTLLLTDAYEKAVRSAEQFWRHQGINAVPAAIINGRYIINGGQTPEAYEKALRAIMAEG